MKQSAAVSEYIAASAPAARPMLRQLRRIVRQAVPDADERMSYGMPYYDYRGRLAYFAAFRTHVSFFMMGKAQRVYLRETKPYQHGRATLQFPVGSALPVTLLKKLLRTRKNEVDQAAAPARRKR